MTNEDRTAGQERPIQWMLPRFDVLEFLPDEGAHVRDEWCELLGCVPCEPLQPESAKETES